MKRKNKNISQHFSFKSYQDLFSSLLLTWIIFVVVVVFSLFFSSCFIFFENNIFNFEWNKYERLAVRSFLLPSSSWLYVSLVFMFWNVVQTSSQRVGKVSHLTDSWNFVGWKEEKSGKVSVKRKKYLHFRSWYFLLLSVCKNIHIIENWTKMYSIVRYIPIDELRYDTHREGFNEYRLSSNRMAERFSH